MSSTYTMQNCTNYGVLEKIINDKRYHIDGENLLY